MSTRPARLILCLSTLLVTACAGTTTTGAGDGGNRDGRVMFRDGGNPDGSVCGAASLDLRGCSCDNPGATRACYTGPATTQNKGLCKDGMQTCLAIGEFFAWGPCSGDTTPSTEVCTDGKDHNCNGLTGCNDPACPNLPNCCTQGMTRSCYDGPANTDGVGPCKAGTQTCNAQGAWGMVCIGEVLPSTEAGHCGDGIDNDCNGFIDCMDAACANDPSCHKSCLPGATQPCYDGPNGTDGVGQCHPGTVTCNMLGQWGMTCFGEVTPGTEAGNCHDGIDNDCNGLVDCMDPACAADPGCVPMTCTPGAMMSCYDGPVGTDGIGACHPGSQTCTQQGQWPPVCAGEVTPTPEAGHCHDGIDNDCNGLLDCQDPACFADAGCQSCTPNTMRACYDGPAATRGIGQCRPGTQTCSAMGVWSMGCPGETLPGTEAGHCHDGIDNDCNGKRDCQDAACANDPGCQPMACTPGTTQACYDGPFGTAGVGPCMAGTQVCQPGGTWSMTCTGEVLPGTEFGNCHDGIDNDCSGQTDCTDLACINDPGCQPTTCTPGTTQPCYDGPAGTNNVGQCKPGFQTCNPQGMWSTVCFGETTPGSEVGRCHDGIDNDCNGKTDCADPACAGALGCNCQPGATQSCYDGPAGTAGVGQCRSGMQVCLPDGSAWGTCLGEVLPGSEAGNCGDGIDNNCNGFTDCADSACTFAASCCVPLGGVISTIYATSAHTLYTIDPTFWTESAVGTTYGVAESMTDLAMTPNGNIYTISSTSLYSINPTFGTATFVMAVPGVQNNALTFLADSTLLAADAGGTLKQIDPNLRTVTTIGSYGGGYGSAGDLVAIGDGTMYGISATGPGASAANNVLITVDTFTGRATPIGPIGYGNVFGLAYHGGRVIAFTGGGDILQLDPVSGAGTFLSRQPNAFYGGTTSPQMPVNGCP